MEAMNIKAMPKPSVSILAKPELPKSKATPANPNPNPNNFGRDNFSSWVIKWARNKRFKGPKANMIPAVLVERYCWPKLIRIKALEPNRPIIARDFKMGLWVGKISPLSRATRNIKSPAIKTLEAAREKGSKLLRPILIAKKLEPQTRLMATNRAKSRIVGLWFIGECSISPGQKKATAPGSQKQLPRQPSKPEPGPIYSDFHPWGFCSWQAFNTIAGVLKELDLAAA